MREKNSGITEKMNKQINSVLESLDTETLERLFFVYGSGKQGLNSKKPLQNCDKKISHSFSNIYHQLANNLPEMNNRKEVGCALLKVETSYRKLPEHLISQFSELYYLQVLINIKEILDGRYM